MFSYVSWVELSELQSYPKHTVMWSLVDQLKLKLRRMNEWIESAGVLSFFLSFFIYTSEENRTFAIINEVESSRWIANVTLSLSLYLSIYLSLSLYIYRYIYIYLCTERTVHTHITLKEWSALRCVVFWMFFCFVFERCSFTSPSEEGVCTLDPSVYKRDSFIQCIPIHSRFNKGQRERERERDMILLLLFWAHACLILWWLAS
jgi:hypothetical protein